MGPSQLHTAYKQSQARIAANCADAKDKIIVALWNTNAEALTKNARLSKENNTLGDDNGRLRHLNDTLETRLAIARGDGITMNQFMLNQMGSQPLN